jgi:hypothetical protein
MCEAVLTAHLLYRQAVLLAWFRSHASAKPKLGRRNEGQGKARRWRQRAEGTKIRNFKF